MTNKEFKGDEVHGWLLAACTIFAIFVAVIVYIAIRGLA